MKYENRFWRRGELLKLVKTLRNKILLSLVKLELFAKYFFKKIQCPES